ncbi:MAG TPA: methionyl-tRNA formyltransferase [Desulfobacterales bacterium]
MKSFRIVFMGTPEFAVPSLAALHRSRHEVKLVVTQPDRPSGRGRQLKAPPVKQAAQRLGYEIIQPEKVRTDAFVETVSGYRPDFQVVVAYCHILTRRILDIPKRGSINVHASLLPKYRGAAPIHWAVINGESETGVTTMFMDEGMDTGDILLSAREPIRGEDDTGSLHDRLAELGAGLLIETLDGLADETVRPAPQDHAKATYAPMFKKDAGIIPWEKKAGQVVDWIRGMTPWPGAFTYLDDQRLKIFKATTSAGPTTAPPGTVVEGFSEELRVATGSGAILIEEIQGASGKRMHIKDFLRGHPIPPGSRFQSEPSM